MPIVIFLTSLPSVFSSELKRFVGLVTEPIGRKLVSSSILYPQVLAGKLLRVLSLGIELILSVTAEFELMSEVLFESVPTITR